MLCMSFSGVRITSTPVAFRGWKQGRSYSRGAQDLGRERQGVGWLQPRDLRPHPGKVRISLPRGLRDWTVNKQLSFSSLPVILNLHQ